MSDLIDRQAAIQTTLEFIVEYLGGAFDENLQKKMIERINALPSDCDKQRLINSIRAGIVATNTKDVYSCGIRNGMRWCKSLLEDESPMFEDSSQYAQPKIIRCKDCKFYSPMNRETKTGICNLTMHQNFGDNWFCAGAERRTDE